AIWSLVTVVGGYALAIILTLGARRAVRLDRPRAPVIATGMVVLAAALIGAAWWTDWSSWTAAGLDPSRTGQGATVFAFLGWQGFYVIVCALMALYVGMRQARGRVHHARPTTFDVIALFYVFVAGQA